MSTDLWFAFINGTHQGPHSLRELQTLARRGILMRSTFVACGRVPYRQADKFPDLAPFLQGDSEPGAIPPSPPPEVGPEAAAVPAEQRGAPAPASTEPIDLGSALLQQLTKAEQATGFPRSGLAVLGCASLVAGTVMVLRPIGFDLSVPIAHAANQLFALGAGAVMRDAGARWATGGSGTCLALVFFSLPVLLLTPLRSWRVGPITITTLVVVLPAILWLVGTLAHDWLLLTPSVPLPRALSSEPGGDRLLVRFIWFWVFHVAALVTALIGVAVAFPTTPVGRIISRCFRPKV